MAVKSAEQLKRRNTTAGQGFGDVKHTQPNASNGQGSVGSHRNSTTTSPAEPPELSAHEAAATLATQTLENAAESLVARYYSRHQAVGQIGRAHV